MTSKNARIEGAAAWVRASSQLGLVGFLVTAIAAPCRAVGVIEFDPATSRGGMAIHPTTGEIYAAESERFAVYNSSGAFVRAFGSGVSQFATTRMQVNPQGRTLIQRTGIQLYSAAGGLEASLTQFSDGILINSFLNPSALAPDGRVYVPRSIAEPFDQIEVFSPQGAFERSIHLPAGERSSAVPDFGPDGLLYVASEAGAGNARTRRVEVFDAAGNFHREAPLGTVIPFTSPLFATLGFQVAPNGNFLLARDGNGLHIDVFGPQGERLPTIYPGLKPTTAFDVTPAGGIALREFFDASRVRVFSPEETARLTSDRPLLHFVEGPFGWARQPGGTPGGAIGDFLNQTGIGADNAAAETAAGMFRVPGAAGVPQTIEITWHPVIAGMDAFGVFDPNSIAIDPAVDPRGYAGAALRSGRLLFRKTDLRPAPDTSTPITKSVELMGGSTVAFFFTGVGTSTYEQFLANPATQRPPFFSNSIANPGRYDQMVAFAANGRTLLGFENLTATNPSGFTPDYNLSDEMFSFNVQLVPIPVPEPTSLFLLATALAVLLRRRRGDDVNLYRTVDVHTNRFASS